MQDLNISDVDNPSCIINNTVGDSNMIQFGDFGY